MPMAGVEALRDYMIEFQSARQATAAAGRS
jgi:hypothetical protein